MGNDVQDLTPIDFHYSRNPFVVGLMREVFTKLPHMTVEQLRYTTCDNVVDTLGHFTQPLRDIIQQLRDIGFINNNFARNWKTGEIPPIILPGTMKRVIKDCDSSEESELRRIEHIVHDGLTRDSYRIDSGAAALLCTRKFSASWRQKMFDIFCQEHTSRNVLRHNVLSAYFAGVRNNEEEESTLPCSNLLNAMNKAQISYEYDPDILSDSAIASYILNREVPFDEAENAFLFALNNTEPRTHRHRRYVLGGLRVYNAWNTRVLFVQDYDVSKYVEPDEALFQNADQRTKENYFRLDDRRTTLTRSSK